MWGSMGKVKRRKCWRWEVVWGQGGVAVWQRGTVRWFLVSRVWCRVFYFVLCRETILPERPLKRLDVSDVIGFFEALDVDGTVCVRDSATAKHSPVASNCVHFCVHLKFRYLCHLRSEELEIDEFVMGCMHLRGEAKTVDMVTLMRENKRMMKKIGDGLRRSEELILDLTTSLRQDAGVEGVCIRVFRQSGGIRFRSRRGGG